MTDPVAYEDELLMRRIDGELSPEAGAAIDAAAAADPALALRLQRMRGLRSLAREAFPAAPDSRDADLARMIAGGSARAPWLRDLSGRLREAFAPRHLPLWGGAAAACFVLGLSVGGLGQGRTAAGFTLASDGSITDRALVRVLDDGLAADGADREGRAVSLTFRDDAGRWCRTFQAAEEGVSGLACRQDGGWRMEALALFQPSASEVRTAAADTPPAVLAAVDTLIAGDTVDAGDEARARDGGWR